MTSSESQQPKHEKPAAKRSMNLRKAGLLSMALHMGGAVGASETPAPHHELLSHHRLERSPQERQQEPSTTHTPDVDLAHQPAQEARTEIRRQTILQEAREAREHQQPWMGRLYIQMWYLAEASQGHNWPDQEDILRRYEQMRTQVDQALSDHPTAEEINHIFQQLFNDPQRPYHYYRGGGFSSAVTGLRERGFSCKGGRELVSALLTDSRVPGVGIRIYQGNPQDASPSGHEAATVRVREGSRVREYEVLASGLADPAGVYIRGEDVLQMFDHQEGYVPRFPEPSTQLEQRSYQGSAPLFSARVMRQSALHRQAHATVPDLQTEIRREQQLSETARAERRVQRRETYETAQAGLEIDFQRVNIYRWKYLGTEGSTLPGTTDIRLEGPDYQPDEQLLAHEREDREAVDAEHLLNFEQALNVLRQHGEFDATDEAGAFAILVLRYQEAVRYSARQNRYSVMRSSEEQVASYRTLLERIPLTWTGIRERLSGIALFSLLQLNPALQVQAVEYYEQNVVRYQPVSSHVSFTTDEAENLVVLLKVLPVGALRQRFQRALERYIQSDERSHQQLVEMLSWAPSVLVGDHQIFREGRVTACALSDVSALLRSHTNPFADPYSAFIQSTTSLADLRREIVALTSRLSVENRNIVRQQMPQPEHFLLEQIIYRILNNGSRYSRAQKIGLVRIMRELYREGFFSDQAHRGYLESIRAELGVDLTVPGP